MLYILMIPYCEMQSPVLSGPCNSRTRYTLSILSFLIFRNIPTYRALQFFVFLTEMKHFVLFLALLHGRLWLIL